MGAQVIEKHFTLDRNMKGPDHKASLEPHELKKMINNKHKIFFIVHLQFVYIKSNFCQLE